MATERKTLYSRDPQVDEMGMLGDYGGSNGWRERESPRLETIERFQSTEETGVGFFLSVCSFDLQKGICGVCAGVEELALRIVTSRCQHDVN